MLSTAIACARKGRRVELAALFCLLERVPHYSLLPPRMTRRELRTLARCNLGAMATGTRLLSTSLDFKAAIGLQTEDKCVPRFLNFVVHRLTFSCCSRRYYGRIKKGPRIRDLPALTNAFRGFLISRGHFANRLSGTVVPVIETPLGKERFTGRWIEACVLLLCLLRLPMRITGNLFFFAGG